MKSRNIGKMIHKIGNWMAKMMYLHILWVVFTLVGLIIFGVMPATVALFTVIRKWLMKDEEVPIFKTFFETYKASMIEKNILGIIYLVVGIFLYVDFKISYVEIQSSFLHIIIWLICVFYLTMLAFSFPVYVHYELKSIKYLKQTFLLVMSSPSQIIILFVLFTALYFLLLLLPVVFIFAGSTMIACPIMWLGLRLFNKVERKVSLIDV